MHQNLENVFKTSKMQLLRVVVKQPCEHASAQLQHFDVYLWSVGEGFLGEDKFLMIYKIRRELLVSQSRQHTHFHFDYILIIMVDVNGDLNMTLIILCMDN